jgi:hypothetical protein
MPSLWGTHPLLLLVVTGAVLHAGSTTREGPEPQVWTAASLVRIAEDDGARDSRGAELWAARGEAESFQIAVRAPERPVTVRGLAVGPLVGPDGAQLPASAFTLYREHYVTVAQGSPPHDGPNPPLGPGRYADALVPFVDPETGAAPAASPIAALPATIAAGTTQPFWIDVTVPRDAVPGRYDGHYAVDIDDRIEVGSVTLHVWPITMPLRPGLRSAFAFGNGSSGSPAGNRELLRHRLSPISVPPDEEGALRDLGINAISLGFWSDANSATCAGMTPPPEVDEIRARAARHLPDLFVYNFTADEIGRCSQLYPLLRQWGQRLHDAGVANLVTMPPVLPLFDDGSGRGRSAVDIWAVLPHQFDRYRDAIDAATRKGDSIWMYFALSQDDYSPKWLLDYPPLNFRLPPGFIAHRLGLAGMLYWKVDRWRGDPWAGATEPGAFAPGVNYPAEGMLLYPGEPVGVAGPVASMRLKWLRDGVDDYDLLALVHQQRGAAYVERAADRVASSWRDWTRDPGVLEAARRELAASLAP